MIKKKKISHYRIIEKIGEGGMGVVYKADDTKLKRTVALKFLPIRSDNTVAMNVDFKTKTPLYLEKKEKDRFIREAQAAASLNHPNITTIYEIDEANGMTFIAMEYIEGQTLKEIIEAAPLKLSTALDITAQVATGLQAAHEKGIVHRDIKSANIILSNSGQVKIMDFGLAKLSGATMLTQVGTTMGTISYMSPEQAGGKDVDARSDIWSLGVVLYEMVSGQLPFKGDVEQTKIYSILNETPEPLTSLRAQVPMEIERIVSKMFAKDPGDRYQSASEIPVDLKNVDISSSSISRVSPAAVAGSRPSKIKRMFTWTTFILMAAIIGFFVWQSLLAPSVEPVRRFVINTEQALNLGQRTTVALSPDGANLVYASQVASGSTLFMRPLNALDSTPIQGTEGADSPFFSPDNQWIGFYADGKLKKVSTAGGAPTTLLETNSFFGATWAEDDMIYFSSFSPEGNSMLNKISANGGQPQVLATSKDSLVFCWPQLLNDGKAILFSVIPANSKNPDEGRIDIVEFKTSTQRTVLSGGILGRYSPTGHIVAGWSGGLIAAPFDLGKLEVTGPTVSVQENVYLNDGYVPDYTFSEDGSLVFVEGKKADPMSTQSEVDTTQVDPAQSVVIESDSLQVVKVDVINRINVVLNWFEHVNDLVPSGSKLSAYKFW